MTEINIVVVFGPSEDSFLIGVGRRFFAQKMPQSLLDKIQNGDLAVGQTSWINVDKTGRYWSGQNFISSKVFFDLQPGCSLYSHITQSGADFVTFPDYDDLPAEPYFFVKHKSQGHWNLSLPDFYITTINAINTKIPDFNAGLKWIIFGRGGTHIYQFENGFLVNTEGPHQDSDHPLSKALYEFDSFQNANVPQGQWVLDKGSSFALYSDRYYFLKFKNTQTRLPEMRMNLPPPMDAKLQELLALAKTPEEQHSLFVEQQSSMAQVQANLNAQISMNNMLNNTMMQAGVSFNNAAGGPQYELVPKRRF